MYYASMVDEDGRPAFFGKARRNLAAEEQVKKTGLTPGKLLYQALKKSTLFRQPDQWSTVRGRAWAIHDGIFDVIEEKWDKLRMIKQVGKHAGVKTFPFAQY